LFKAVLLDLDRTLLDIDIPELMQHYVELLTPRAAPYVDSEEFPELLWEATARTEKDLSQECHNYDTWRRHFFELADIDDEEGLQEAIDAFYRDDFPTLSHLGAPAPAASELIEHCLADGCDVVVATNPVFPRAAVRERMRWAEVHDYDFAHVTVMENSYYCKPHPGYYRQILEVIDREPEECIMVGDDEKRDLPAGELGIATFWIHPSPAAPEPDSGCDYRGTLADLLDRFKNCNWT
jgi:HAD superfamily hydrolase (TIGR01509 family)